MRDSVVTRGSARPLPHRDYSTVVGGPDAAELDQIGRDMSRAYAEHDMPPGAIASLLGGLLTIARGPHGVAATSALVSLRNAQKAVNHR